MEIDDVLRAELKLPVEPWSYNPSRWSQRIPICILAAVAFLMAAYMALYQWRLIGSVWDPVFGEQTQQVLDSNVAQTMDRWIGVPDAAFGAFAYLGDAILGLAGSTRRWQFRPWMVVLFGIDVIPLGVVSSVLVALQATVVGKWFFLCIVTAVISLILIFHHATDAWQLWMNDLTSGLAIVVLALASYWRPLRHAHLVILVVAGWLVGFGRFYGSPPLPPALQNDILVGLLLMLFAIVPNDAGEPPESWRRWYSEK